MLENSYSLKWRERAIYEGESIKAHSFMKCELEFRDMCGGFCFNVLKWVLKSKVLI